LGWCHVTFHSSLTVQSHARQLYILTNQKTALGVYSVFIPEDLVGSLTLLIGRIENMISEVTPTEGKKQQHFRDYSFKFDLFSHNDRELVIIY